MSENENNPETTVSTSIESFTNAEKFHEQLAKVDSESEAVPEENTEEAPLEEVEQTQEKAPQDDDDEDEVNFVETPKGKMIPKGRFNKELQKRKELEQKFRDQEIQNAQLAKEYDLLKQAVSQLYGMPQQNQAAPQNKEDFVPIDEEAHSLYKKEIDQLRAQQEALTQQQRAVLFRADVKEQEIDFMKSKPDLYDAFNYLQDVKTKEYTAVGYGENDARQLAKQELQNKALIVYQNQRNVAKMAYELAEAYGYKPKGKVTQKQGPNLEAIGKNMDKSASVASVPTVAGGPRMPDIKETFTKTGRIDASKFQQMLAAVNSPRQ
jgi:hypothetical protein